MQDLENEAGGVSTNLFRVQGVVNSLWSGAVAPLDEEQRTWGAARLCSALLTGPVSLPAWLLASALMALGMTGVEALAAILAGSLLMLALMVLQAHVGTKYGIGFAVAARPSFGVFGAKVPLALRGLAGCGWFGIHCAIGALALSSLARLIRPQAGVRPWVCLAVFWMVSVAWALLAPNAKRSLGWITPLLIVLLALALLASGGVQVAPHASLIPQPGLWDKFMPALTAVTGLWAMLAAGVADSSRRVKAQRPQRRGLFGCVAAMLAYSVLAVGVSSRTAVWNPIDLMAHLPHSAWAIACLAAVILASLGGAAANLKIAAGDAASLRPGTLPDGFATVLAAAIGMAMMPWRLIATPEAYLHGWLTVCAGVLGPVCGVVLGDYFLVRRRWLNVDSLYERDGIYEYAAGVNPKAIGALAGGMTMALAGWFLPPLHMLYDAAGFVGFGVAAALYLLQTTGPPIKAEIPPTPLLIPAAEFDH